MPIRQQLHRWLVRWRRSARFRQACRQQERQLRAEHVRWLVRVRGYRLRRWMTAPSTRQVAFATTLLLLTGGAVYAATLTPAGEPAGTPLRADPGSESGAVRSASRQQPPAPGGSEPGVTAPGIYLTVAANEFGELEVAERVLVADPIVELTLTPPPAPEGAEGPAPRLDDLQVAADGEPVPVPGTVDETTVIDLSVPASSFELRYRVVDAAARSEPAPPGRATLSLRPATVRTLGDAPVVVEVHDAVVHNLVCVDLRRQRQLCGIAGPDGWRTGHLPASGSHVVALVDLPDPAA